MGGKSKSKSSSSNSTTNTTVNESLNSAISGDVEEGATAISAKSVSITQVDPNALDFASKTLDGVGGIITQLLENQAQTYSAATDLAGNAVANLTAASGAKPVQLNKHPLTQSQKIWLGMGGFASVAALTYMLKGRKK